MAGIGGGLGGAVGIAAESTYGTWVAPTRWIEVRNFKMQERPHVTQGTGLAYGRTVDLGSRRTVTWKDAGGSFDYEVLNSGFGLLLNNIMGSNATLTPVGTTSANSLTCNLGVPDNQNYLSMQSLVPNTAGTIFPQSFHGCKFLSAEFSIDMDNPLMCNIAVDSQQLDTTQTAGSPSYTSNTTNFTFQGMNFKVGAFGSEASIDGVRKMTCKIERGLYVDRIYMGQAAKSEPITNAVTKISGTADVDLTAADKSVFWDIFHTQTAVPSIVMQFVGSAIGSTGQFNTVSLNPTDVFIDSGGTPELDGPGQVTATLNWSGLIDANNDSALIAKLITGDSSL